MQEKSTKNGVMEIIEMIKVRITFVDNEKGNRELEEHIDLLKDTYDVVSISKKYAARGNSIYSSVYIDLEDKK